MLAELEAIWHKRDEAAQQNEAPVTGSVEGQSVPVKIETLLGKVVQLKTVPPYWREQPWKECMLAVSLECLNLPSKQQNGHFSSYHYVRPPCICVCVCMYVCVLSPLIRLSQSLCICMCVYVCEVCAGFVYL